MPFPGGPQSGGNRIDLTTLTPFNNESNALANTGGTLTTLLSITGKGYLSSAILSASTAVAHQIKITIDGVVSVLLGTSLSTRFCGIASKK